MPIDGSGNFTRSYNWTNDRDLGIKILASRMDGEFQNYANAINTTLFRNGLVPMTGNLNVGQNNIIGLGNGLVSAPSVRWNDEASTGWYLNGLGKPTLAVQGAARLEVNTVGAVLYGKLSANEVYSAKGTVSAPHNTAVDLFTFTGNYPRTVLVTAAINNADATLYHEVALVRVNGDGGAGTTAALTVLANGTNLDISLSGATVRASQSTGATQTISWAYTLLSNPG